MALRFVYTDHVSSNEELLEKFSTLQVSRVHKIAIEVFKILNESNNLLSDMFKVRSSNYDFETNTLLYLGKEQ